MDSAKIIAGITTISAISLADGWDNIETIAENFKELYDWYHSLLPENKVLRVAIYGLGAAVGLKVLPFCLRRTSFYSYAEDQIRHFHRTTSHPKLIDLKADLLKELKEENDLPLVDGKLVLLEANAGGGTNISYYPDGCDLIAVDTWEKGKEYMEQNFPEELEVHRINLNRYLNSSLDILLSVPDNSVSAIICMHSLCSCKSARMALLEFKRVLKTGGKIYFVEHVRCKKTYSPMWFSQLNFSLQNSLVYNCKFIRTREIIEAAGFSKTDIKEVDINQRIMGMVGPMHSLTPHVYGYAIK